MPDMHGYAGYAGHDLVIGGDSAIPNFAPSHDQTIDTPMGPFRWVPCQQGSLNTWGYYPCDWNV